MQSHMKIFNDDSKLEGLGRGLTAVENPKSKYVRWGHKGRYENIRKREPDPFFFEKLCRLTREEFDEFYDIARADLASPLEARQKRPKENYNA